MHNIKASNFQSIPRQSISLEERRKQEPVDVNCCGMKIRVNAGVYATSGDSELMIETVNMSSTETFLEVGCGTGVVSVSLSKRAKSGIGVDINDLAIENSKFNAQRHNVKNVQFFKSNVFENISGKFDVIICNPPYTKHDIFDNIDRMYWDPDDEMKRKFFKDVNNYLKKNGRIYFGWANFGDIDVDLPLKLAKENGCVLEKITEKNHANKFSFLVLEFKGSGI